MPNFHMWNLRRKKKKKEKSINYQTESIYKINAVSLAIFSFLKGRTYISSPTLIQPLSQGKMAETSHFPNTHWTLSSVQPKETKGCLIFTRFEHDNLSLYPNVTACTYICIHTSLWGPDQILDRREIFLDSLSSSHLYERLLGGHGPPFRIKVKFRLSFRLGLNI